MAKIRVRARTVDMLGRQQIAGIPTAISELFKNAHDAYARNVEVDYYRYDDLFVLRDDGLGMGRHDFERRWLTLGTESKLGRKGGIEAPFRDEAQPLRTVLGEKGIGRLAIAAIGPQVLVLTRSRRRRRAATGVAAFVNWGLFALPGIDLDEIDIPVLEFPGGGLPAPTDVRQMVDQVRSNVRALTRRLGKDQIREIEEQLNQFDIDPQECADFLPHGPTLKGNGHGTHFLIKPADETLAADIQRLPEQTVAPPLIKMLIGFTNTMTPQHRRPAIIARFREHMQDGVIHNLISESEFFTPTEFTQADHHFRGDFDECGHFRGTVKVYNHRPVEHRIPWTGSAGTHTHCGPFGINVAYVQGAARDSILPPEEHARMINKLTRIGGLYIYRDGVRVLPYGNSDYDFLNIEQRRTKSAAYYFFSYRRMFGVVEISRERNQGLVEKAGREGFRENTAYRQFRAILENFFVQLAADFFRDEGAHSQLYVDAQPEIIRASEIKRERAKVVRSAHQEFERTLDRFFGRVNERRPERECADIIDSLNARLSELSQAKGPVEAAANAVSLEAEARGQLRELRELYQVRKPQGVGLNRELRRDWEAYQAESRRLDSEVFLRADNLVGDILSDFSRRIGADLDRLGRFNLGVKDTARRHRERIESAAMTVRRELEHARERVGQSVQQSIDAIDAAVERGFAQFAQRDAAGLGKGDLKVVRKRLESEIARVGEEQQARLNALREELGSITVTAGPRPGEITEVLEEELHELRERELAALELAQVGMALGIVHHEFTSAINAIRAGLRSLSRWADRNQQLKSIYKNLRTAFEHLDGYLALFTPLNRRLQRRKAPISGKQIHTFLTDLFGERLSRHGVELTATARFSTHQIVEYPSSIYPCFVNLVDNAIFWLSRPRRSERRIILDSDGTTFIISDTGPGVKPRDADAVFELGFSRKPDGRGMGLYISRETLKRIGYELTLDAWQRSRGATFRIRPAAADDAATASEEDDNA